MSLDAPPPQSMYFGPDESPLFGVWHPRHGDTPAAFAVVMLGPWGAEDMSAHRAWRGLAAAIAAQGVACLRFDFDGCGDAYDPDPQADYWALWRDAVGQAVAVAKRLGSVQQIVLVGMRLGALLAAELASTRSDIQALVALAPLRGGKAYLKELRMLGGAMAQGEAGQHYAVFAAGFGLNARTAASLSGSALPASVLAATVAVIDRDDFGIGPRWTQSLAAQGVNTSYTVLPGYTDMVLTAHKAQPAQQMFNQVLVILEGLSQQSTAQVSALPVAALTEVRQQVTITVHGLTVTETLIPPFGKSGMTGVRVEPVSMPLRSHKGILILNSSAERRVGPNRMWVGFARERAAQGDMVVRLDLPGLGESLQDCSDGTNLVYPADTIEQVKVLFQQLARECPTVRWAVLGLCSGGYHSYRLGVGEPGIDRVFALNTFGLLPTDVANFDAREQASLQFIVTQNAASSLWKADRWLKLLSGRADVRLIASSALGRLLMQVRMAVVRVGIRLRLLPSTTLMQELLQLTARGGQIHFVFATTDPGPAILREGTAHEVSTLFKRGCVTEDLVHNADHVFAGLRGRLDMFAHLHRRIDEWSIPLASSQRQITPSSTITSTSSPAAT